MGNEGEESVREWQRKFPQAARKNGDAATYYYGREGYNNLLVWHSEPKDQVAKPSA